MSRPADRKTRHQQTRRIPGAENASSKYTGPIILPEKKVRPGRHAALPKPADFARGFRTLTERLAAADWRRALPRLGILAAGAAALVVAVLGVSALVGNRTVEAPAATALPAGLATQRPRDYPQRGEVLSEPLMTASPGGARDLSFGAADIRFDKDSINMPAGIYDTEIVFSAGSGSLDGEVLTDLYRYSLDTGEYEKIVSTGEYKGEIFETLINHNWIVWLDTDHGTNNKIYVYDRNDNTSSKKFLLQNNKNGKPKLQMYGDTLVYMERTSKTVDSLVLFDLLEQDQITLFSFNDVVTYGVSAPCVYEDWIVWAGPVEEKAAEATAVPDATSAAQEEEVSAIYYMKLDEDFDANGAHPRIYEPGTYVNDPLFNGEVFVWSDGNKKPGRSLYISEPSGTPAVVATGITTYSLGDGIVVYGKDQGVWVYIYGKGETCRLTAEGERGILPVVTGRTVVWLNKSAASNRDVLRFIILTDRDLYPESAANAEG